MKATKKPVWRKPESSFEERKWKAAQRLFEKRSRNAASPEISIDSNEKPRSGYFCYKAAKRLRKLNPMIHRLWIYQKIMRSRIAASFLKKPLRGFSSESIEISGEAALRLHFYRSRCAAFHLCSSEPDSGFLHRLLSPVIPEPTLLTYLSQD